MWYPNGHCARSVVPREASVNLAWSQVSYEHEQVSDLGRADVITVGVADLHATGRRWACDGHRPRHIFGLVKVADQRKRRSVYKLSKLHLS